MSTETHDGESRTDDERALSRRMGGDVVDVTAGIILALEQISTMSVSNSTDRIDSMDQRQ